MTHEKIFKREDGDTLIIRVGLNLDLEWDGDYVIKDGNGEYIKSRGKAKHIPTPSEILEVKLELWNKLKPV